MLYRTVFVCLVALMLSGPALTARAQSNEDLQEEIATLKARMRQLEDHVLGLQSKINEFHNQMRDGYHQFQEGIQNNLQEFSTGLQNNLDERVRAMGYRVVNLDIVSKEYRKIDTNSGYFLISIKKIQPLTQGGYRLSFNIGNPNLASYSGIQLDLAWGENYNGGVHTYDQWRKSLGGAKYTYDAKIPPGSWIEFFVDVPVQSTKELAYIECRMDVETVELNLKNPF